MLASDSARDFVRSGSYPATIGNVAGSTQVTVRAMKNDCNDTGICCPLLNSGKVVICLS